MLWLVSFGVQQNHWDRHSKQQSETLQLIMLGGGEDYVALISHCTLKCMFHCTVLKINLISKLSFF